MNLSSSIILTCLLVFICVSQHSLGQQRRVITARPRQTVTIDCNVSAPVGTQNIRTTWEKPVGNIISTKPKLILSNIGQSEVGIYFCRAYYYVGGVIQSQMNTVDLRLNSGTIENVVQVGSQLSFEPPLNRGDRHVVQYGDQVYISCRSSDPTARITWEYPNRVVNDKNFLYLVNIRIDQAGQYTCLGLDQRTGRTIRKSFMLEVTPASGPGPVQPRPPQPPAQEIRITITPTVLSVQAGSDGTLRCSAYENNAPIRAKIGWRYQDTGRDVTEDRRNQILSNQFGQSTLRLGQLDSRDHNRRVECYYLARASSAMIQVIGRPQPPRPVDPCSRPNVFRCRLSSTCVDISQRCDGRRDCPRGEDEDAGICQPQPPRPVDPCSRPNVFRCSQSSTCVDIAKRCDGRRDCPRGEDEDAGICQQCDPIEAKCENYNGQSPRLPTFSEAWRCDGENDCGNYFDEMNCQYNGTRCGGTHFSCPSNRFNPNSAPIQIPNAFVCDNQPDCPGNEDESSCTPPVIINAVQNVQSVTVSRGERIRLVCQARSQPMPRIIWRFNWRCLPNKDRSSVNYFVPASCDYAQSTLEIINAQDSDAGIYNCEAVLSTKRTMSQEYRVIVRR